VGGARTVGKARKEGEEERRGRGRGKGKETKKQLEKRNRDEGDVVTGERGSRSAGREPLERGGGETQNAEKAVVQLAVEAARETVPEKGGGRARYEVTVGLGEDAVGLEAGEVVRAVRRALRRERRGVGFSVRVLRRDVAGSKVEVAEKTDAVQLTPRDVDVLGFLAIARRLTADQLRALAFPGRHVSIPYRRLALLAAAMGAGGYVRQESYFGAQGERAKVVAWSVTTDGYAAVADRLKYLRAYSTTPAVAATLEHDLWLADLFVAMAASGGVPVRPEDLPFRWLCDTDKPLAFRTLDDGADWKTNLLRPDAIIELPEARRRIFIEAERGTHTIAPTSTTNTGGTTVKAKRYARFVGAPTDADGKVTAYRSVFPDGYQPELLFIVHSEWRRVHVLQALAADRAKDVNPVDFKVHVLTMAQAKDLLIGGLPRGWKASAAGAEGEEPAPLVGRALLRLEDAQLLRDGFNVLLDELRARGGTKELRPEPKSLVRRTRDLIVWLVDRTGGERPSWSGRERRRPVAAGDRG